MGQLRDCVSHPLNIHACASQLRLKAGHLTGQLQHCVDQNSFHFVNPSYLKTGVFHWSSQ
jgi:hypothetical protein